VINDEIPKSIAVVVGHVCGVIAVGMAALSVFGVWRVAHNASLAGLISLALCTGLTLLLFRWAGALTGYWDTSGRLSVPKAVYAAFGAFFVVLTVVGVYVLAVHTPASFDSAFAILTGALGGAVLVYLCRLAVRRFK
jgi:hypothetical protein